MAVIEKTALGGKEGDTLAGDSSRVVRSVIKDGLYGWGSKSNALPDRQTAFTTTASADTAWDTGIDGWHFWLRTGGVLMAQCDRSEKVVVSGESWHQSGTVKSSAVDVDVVTDGTGADEWAVWPLDELPLAGGDRQWFSFAEMGKGDWYLVEAIAGAVDGTHSITFTKFLQRSNLIAYLNVTQVQPGALTYEQINLLADSGNYTRPAGDSDRILYALIPANATVTLDSTIFSNNTGVERILCNRWDGDRWREVAANA